MSKIKKQRTHQATKNFKNQSTHQATKKHLAKKTTYNL